MRWLDPANPGAVGYLVGGLLLLVGVLLWRRFTRRRFHAEVAAEYGGKAVGRSRVPQDYWHPSQGPRREPATELMARCADRPDATVVIPRQRKASR